MEQTQGLITAYRAQLRRLYGPDASRRTRITVADGTVTIRAWDLPKGNAPVTLPLGELPWWTEALSWRTPIREDKQNRVNKRWGPQPRIRRVY